MLSFSKYQALGNDFILIENIKSQKLPSIEKCIFLCDRHFGIGADGIIFLCPPQNFQNDFRMKIYNSDGSEPQMCGNGIRCLAQFIRDQKLSSKMTLKFETLAGIIITEFVENLIKVQMNIPEIKASKIPCQIPKEKIIHHELEVEDKTFYITCVNMGNPHTIIFVEDVSKICLEKYGPLIENHPLFPEKTNVEFVEVIHKNHLKMRVWERGAGITLACGTGACASLVAAVLENKCENVALLELPGGSLNISWENENSPVWMTGPAQLVYQGGINI
jgi:diaminopimelate epimerase